MSRAGGVSFQCGSTLITAVIRAPDTSGHRRNVTTTVESDVYPKQIQLYISRFTCSLGLSALLMMYINSFDKYFDGYFWLPVFEDEINKTILDS